MVNYLEMEFPSKLESYNDSYYDTDLFQIHCCLFVMQELLMMKSHCLYAHVDQLDRHCLSVVDDDHV